MTHPDWVLRHRMANTEVRNIRGKYYLYSITQYRPPKKENPEKNFETNSCY